MSRAEVRDFRARHAYWAADWERYAGAGALADQVRFEREWGALRTYAAAHGISLIGDMPIYVAEDSAEVASHPELFSRELVAGAAPDVSHPEGQLWGQPVYDWRAMRRDGYRWWIERFRRSLELVDVAGSTTSAASSRTGRCRGGRRARSPDAGAAALVLRSSRPSNASWAICR